MTAAGYEDGEGRPARVRELIALLRKAIASTDTGYSSAEAKILIERGRGAKSAGAKYRFKP